MTGSAGACAALVVALAVPGGLRSALDHYDFGEYATACEQLERLRTDGLARDDEVVALRYLGACHHILGAKEQASAAFEALLDADPRAELDPVQFPPELVAFFRDLRDRRGPTLAVTPAAPPAPAASAEAGRSSKSRALAVLPFGVGQFQNDQPGKGAVFASLETVSLGVGIVGLVLFEAEKESGAFLAGGRFEDEDKAAALQTLYVAGLATFGALWALGAVDALVNFDDAPGVAVLPAPGGFVLGGRF